MGHVEAPNLRVMAGLSAGRCCCALQLRNPMLQIRRQGAAVGQLASVNISQSPGMPFIVLRPTDVKEVPEPKARSLTVLEV